MDGAPLSVDLGQKNARKRRVVDPRAVEKLSFQLEGA
jgi:hypothetical protein